MSILFTASGHHVSARNDQPSSEHRADCPHHISTFQVKAALSAANLTAGAVCMRYPAETYRLGAFTHPQASVRAQAVALTVAGCRWAQAMDAAELVIWPQVICEWTL